MTTETRRRRQLRPRRSSPDRALTHAQKLRELAQSEWDDARARVAAFLENARLARRQRLAEAREAERHAVNLQRLRDGLPLRQRRRATADVVAPPPASASMSGEAEKPTRKKHGGKKSRVVRNGASHARA